MQVFTVLIIATVLFIAFWSSHKVYFSTNIMAASTLSFDIRKCSGVYLDVGTNIGVQIRKLYDPHLFPNAEVLPIFDKYFGEDRREICAIGFEPNPTHTGYLQRLQDNLQCRGRRVHIFTESAATTNASQLTFYADPSAPKERHEWGASLLNWQHTNDSFNVQGIDLAEFIMADVLIPLHRMHQMSHKVATVHVPIVMKMDIEGAEYGVVLHLLAKGVLCKLDFGMLEWHSRFTGGDYNNSIKIEQTMDQLMKQFDRYDACNTILAHIDDESYGAEGFHIPLVECGNPPLHKEDKFARGL
jgi:hypothetical protein